MGKNAIVFAGRNGLDVSDLRVAVLRIPEVSQKIREAQKILDQRGSVDLDLHTYIASDDETYLRNIRLKALAAAIVQIGLYERHIKYQPCPDFIIGNSNGDSALRFITGRISLQELVEQSEAMRGANPAFKLLAIEPEKSPLLAGISLEEYDLIRVIKRADSRAVSYELVQSSSLNVRSILQDLYQQEEVMQFINVGPVTSLLDSDLRRSGLDESEILDSIDMDPMLSWFWRHTRPLTSVSTQKVAPIH